MRRFILRSNIERFEAALAEETSARAREWLRTAIAADRRELAVLDAAAGVRNGPAVLDPPAGASRLLHAHLQRALESGPGLFIVIEPGPGLHIVEASQAYARATLVEAAAVAGREMFEVFPDNPDDPLADGVSNLHASLRRAADTRLTDPMPIQRYDVRDASGVFVERHWEPVNTPLFDEHGRLAYILHEARDVTASVLARRLRQPRAADASTDQDNGPTRTRKPSRT